ncbi:MAG TPA: LamG-like jellyroll fold domain-containing protein [Planctomycetota bacterium]
MPTQVRLILALALSAVVPACGEVILGAAPSGPAVLTLSQAALTFACDEGASDPASQDIVLSNTGGESATWTVSADEPWLSVSPSTGTLPPGQSVNLTVSVDATYQLQGWDPAPPTAGAPTARWVHSMEWTGSEVVVWGGSVAVAPSDVDSGALYDPVGNTWLGATTLVGAPAARRYASTVWDGNDVIFWGGTSAGGHNTGFRYRPDSWTGATTTTGAPGPREAHTAVWTGSEMIIWGGWDGTLLNTGAKYASTSDTWVGTTTTVGAIPRQEHVAVWTGDRMIVWGGRNGADASSSLNTGALYNSSSDSWVGTVTTTGAPSARTAASAVWTGREMVVWGGHDGAARLATGARYSPSMDAWIGTVPTAGAPSARWRHRGVWTGSRMVVWGGENNLGMTNTGGVYRPPIPAIGEHVALIGVTAPGLTGPTTSVQLTVTDLAGGLAAHWRFDEIAGSLAADASGQGNTGTLVGGGAWTAGHVDGALNFDGADDYVQVPDAPSLNPTGELTIATWINADIWEAANRIVQKGVTVNFQYVLEVSATNQLRFGMGSVGDVFVAAPTLGQWHHIAGTYDGSVLKFYIDGVLAGQQAATGSLFVSNEPLFIGTKWAASPAVDFLDARLDDLRIYNRALPLATIQDLATP